MVTVVIVWIYDEILTATGSLVGTLIYTCTTHHSAFDTISLWVSVY
jgi:hypothetical protein